MLCITQRNVCTLFQPQHDTNVCREKKIKKNKENRHKNLALTYKEIKTRAILLLSIYTLYTHGTISFKQ